MATILLPKVIQRPLPKPGLRSEDKKIEITLGDLVLITTSPKRFENPGYSLGVFESVKDVPKHTRYYGQHWTVSFDPCWGLLSVRFGKNEFPSFRYHNGRFNTSGIEDLFVGKEDIIKVLQEKELFKFYIPFIERMERPYR